MGGGGSITDGQWAASPFALFLVQVIVIISLSRVLAWLLKYLKQPAVVAEMLAGIIIGPTALGRVPGFSANLFPPSSIGILGVISNFSLIFFLFIVGLELDPAKLKADFKVSAFISFWGIFIPMIASLIFAIVIYQNPEYSNTNLLNMTLFLTCVLGISALPVLARILAERRMLTTRLGGLSMTVAAVDDIIAWAMLAVILTLVRSSTALGVLWTVLLTVGELIFMGYVVRPFLKWLVKRDAGHTHLSADTFLYLCLTLIICSYIAEIIGLSALIGAFQVGLLIPRTSNLSHHLSEKIEYLIVSVFMPIYFANSGLKTQFGLINDGASVGMAILVIVVATGSKIIGILIPAYWLKIPNRMSLVIAVLMSCKGLLALLLLGYGNDLGIITPKFFAILVLMVLLTTMMTVPLVILVDPPSRAKKSAAEVAAWEEQQNRLAAEEEAKKEQKMLAKEQARRKKKGLPALPEGASADAAGSSDSTALVDSSATAAAASAVADGSAGSSTAIAGGSPMSGGAATASGARPRGSTAAAAGSASTPVGGEIETGLEMVAAAAAGGSASTTTTTTATGSARPTRGSSVDGVAIDAAAAGSSGGVGGAIRNIAQSIRQRTRTLSLAFKGGAGSSSHLIGADGARDGRSDSLATGSAAAIAAEEDATFLAGIVEQENEDHGAGGDGAGPEGSASGSGSGGGDVEGGSGAGGDLDDFDEPLDGGSEGGRDEAYTVLPPFHLMLTVREPGMAKVLVRIVNLIPASIEGTALAPAGFLPEPSFVAATHTAHSAALVSAASAALPSSGPLLLTDGVSSSSADKPAPASPAAENTNAAAATAAAMVVDEVFSERGAAQLLPSTQALQVGKPSALFGPDCVELVAVSKSAAATAEAHMAAAAAVALTGDSSSSSSSSSSGLFGGLSARLFGAGSNATMNPAARPVFIGTAASAALLRGLAKTKLTLNWVRDSIEMPSSYMNMATSLRDIRDNNLIAAMDMCRFTEGAASAAAAASIASETAALMGNTATATSATGGSSSLDIAKRRKLKKADEVGVTCYPSEHPLQDALSEAHAKRASMMFCSYRLLRDHSSPQPVNPDELAGLLTSVLNTHDRSCHMAVLFDYAPEQAITTVAVGVDALHPASSEAALFFARKVDPAVDVLLVCTGFPCAPSGHYNHQQHQQHSHAQQQQHHQLHLAHQHHGGAHYPHGEVTASSRDSRSRSRSAAGPADIVDIHGSLGPLGVADSQGTISISGSSASASNISTGRSTASSAAAAAAAASAASGASVPSSSSAAPPPPPPPSASSGARMSGAPLLSSSSSALPVVPEMPTVGTFATLLKGASDEDIKAYQKAVAAAVAARTGGSGGDDDAENGGEGGSRAENSLSSHAEDDAENDKDDDTAPAPSSPGGHRTPLAGSPEGRSTRASFNETEFLPSSASAAASGIATSNSSRMRSRTSSITNNTNTTAGAMGSARIAIASAQSAAMMFASPIMPARYGVPSSGSSQYSGASGLPPHHPPHHPRASVYASALQVQRSLTAGPAGGHHHHPQHHLLLQGAGTAANTAAGGAGSGIDVERSYSGSLAVQGRGLLPASSVSAVPGMLIPAPINPYGSSMDHLLPPGFAYAELPLLGFLSSRLQFHLPASLYPSSSSAGGGDSAAITVASHSSSHDLEDSTSGGVIRRSNSLRTALQKAGLLPQVATALSTLPAGRHASLEDASDASLWPLGRHNTYECIPLPTEAALHAAAVSAGVNTAAGAPVSPAIFASAVAAINQPQALARCARTSHAAAAAASARGLDFFGGASPNPVQLVVLGADPSDYDDDGRLITPLPAVPEVSLAASASAPATLASSGAAAGGSAESTAVSVDSNPLLFSSAAGTGVAAASASSSSSSSSGAADGSEAPGTPPASSSSAIAAGASSARKRASTLVNNAASAVASALFPGGASARKHEQHRAYSGGSVSARSSGGKPSEAAIQAIVAHLVAAMQGCAAAHTPVLVVFPPSHA